MRPMIRLINLMSFILLFFSVFLVFCYFFSLYFDGSLWFWRYFELVGRRGAILWYSFVFLWIDGAFLVCFSFLLLLSSFTAKRQRQHRKPPSINEKKLCASDRYKQQFQFIDEWQTSQNNNEKRTEKDSKHIWERCDLCVGMICLNFFPLRF